MSPRKLLASVKFGAAPVGKAGLLSTGTVALEARLACEPAGEIPVTVVTKPAQLAVSLSASVRVALMPSAVFAGVEAPAEKTVNTGACAPQLEELMVAKAGALTLPMRSVTVSATCQTPLGRSATNFGEIAVSDERTAELPAGTEISDQLKLTGVGLTDPHDALASATLLAVSVTCWPALGVTGLPVTLPMVGARAPQLAALMVRVAGAETKAALSLTTSCTE